MTTPKQHIKSLEKESPAGGDKFTWKPGDIVWTKKPTSAQQLAGVQRANEGPRRKKK